MSLATISKMKSSNFAVSLTAADHSGISDNSVVDYACSHAQVIEVLSSGVLSSQSTQGSGIESHVVLVCDDSSLFFFQTPQKPPSLPHLTLPDPVLLPLAARRFSKTSIHSTRSAFSISSLAPTLHAVSRSRITSGITTDSVEAPKNYVDFEDEPDKLKDILSGNMPSSRRTSIDSPHDRALLSPTSPSPQESENSSPRKARQEPRSLLSATASPSYTPHSPASASTSPRQASDEDILSYRLQLTCHTKLFGSPLRAAISVIELIDSERLITLQVSGIVSIISVRDGLVVSTVAAEDQPFQPPEGMSGRPSETGVWLWKRLQVIQDHECKYILISASLDENTTPTSFLDSTEPENLDLSRVVLYEVVSNDFSRGIGISLEKVGEWSCHGIAESITLYHERPEVLIFAYFSTDHYLFTHRLHVLARGWQHLGDTAVTEVHNPVNIAFTNALKAMKVPRTLDESSPKRPTLPLSRVTLDVAQKVGQLELNETCSGFKTICTHEGYLRGLIWTPNLILGFECQGTVLRTLFSTPSEETQMVSWLSDTNYCLFSEDAAETFELVSVDGNGDAMLEQIPINMANRVQPHSLYSFNVSGTQAAHMISPSALLAVGVDDLGRRVVQMMLTATPDSANISTLWKGNKFSTSSTPLVSTILPVEVDNFLLGYTNGHLQRMNLAQLCGNEPVSSSSHYQSDTPMGSGITSLFSAQNLRTREWFVVGGGEDGSIVVWQNTTLNIVARWIIFLYPLESVYQIPERTGPLRDCIFCVSQDGTIAVVALDGFQFLYIVPASTSPLIRLDLGGDNLMLSYEDGHCRLWDVKAREFWRSLSNEKAEELFSQGGWTTLKNGSTHQQWKMMLGPIAACVPSVDLDSTISLDLEKFVTETSMMTKAISTSRQETRVILDALDRLRTVLSTMLTPGLNDEIDNICTGKLGIRPSRGFMGFQSSTASSVYCLNKPQDAWTISGEVTAARALSIVAVLRGMSLFEELAEPASIVIAFYAASLKPVVGHLFQPPDLAFLARQWFSSSNEVRHAARVLLETSIACLSDDEALGVAEQWQHQLPTLQPTAERESMTAALGLFLTGYIASEKYALLSVNALTDISKSIALYLHDEHSIYRALAIDLCSRGFHVWQHYVDSMEILRALFSMATTTKKEDISSQNVGTQARIAVLQIAGSNTPLFMTTLGLDILHPQSLDHRRSVMQIVAFLIRKRPFVLYPNLPRLVEAVVKSLDPNSSNHREAVLDTATEIIGQVVKSFPTVDFHMGTQRLAVGTSEGAAVMYDLKTGTRLYVLEGHKKKIIAISFSPDGRRLVTLSLDERTVLVWKVGTSFSSFFKPGAPPRQGQGASGEPFKTYPFHLGHEAEMTIPETIDAIRFEWVGDRSVKLKIWEGTMTFAT